MNLVRKTSFMLLCMLSIILFFGCPYHYPERKYPIGEFPDSVCNLTHANSVYDDINMDLPVVFFNAYLLFSSNRLTNGGTFDLVTKMTTFSWNQIVGKFSIETNVYETDNFVQELAQATQTESNEFGPSIISYSFKTQTGSYNEKYFLIYSDDFEGNQNARYIEVDYRHNLQANSGLSDSLKNEKRTISFLNHPEFNEGYVSFQTDFYSLYDSYHIHPSTKFEKMIYNNDSLGHYDIFSIDIPQNVALDSFLRMDAKIAKHNLTAINSPYNDRCPNVNRNFMVFSSNRPGGLGGYDFYYSIYTNGQWSEPINFGAPINSEYDEFRAIAMKAHDFKNQLLLFSSNRPGGKGGFDLYFTGIDVMPD
jgi:hypothetical protein